MRKVEVIDCTLRDGEQAPGVWFTQSEKLELAKLLDAARVDVLDAGFPGSSAEELETMQALRAAKLRARIGATARAVLKDVVAAERARAHEVFLFLPTSDIQLIGIGLSRAAAVRRLRDCAEEVVGRGMTLDVVAEDAYRADPAWLVELWTAIRDIPIQRFVLCDTVGVAVPHRIEELFRTVRMRVDPKVALCTHCHDDYGMATANTIAAVLGGAEAVTCTVNGIGERAGNADLAATVAALTHLLGFPHDVDPSALRALATAVDRISGAHSSVFQPVTGANVYRHESGVHVDAMLRDSRSYEPLPAAWSGGQTELVLGKHSGTALVRHILKREGIELDDDRLHALLAEVKHWATTRDKSDHDRMHAEVQRFRERALGGIPFHRVIARARELLAA